MIWGGVIFPGTAPNIAREIALDAGLPRSAHGMTVSRACASGLQAVTLAAAAIERGEADVIIAGGSDSTSNAEIKLPQKVVHAMAPLALGKATLVLVDSGQPRRLATSGYNERRRELQIACDELRRRIGEFESLREVNHERVLVELAELSPVSQRRLRHIITEHARVEQFVERLKQGDLIQLGRLLSASHHSLSDDYDVSTPELDTLCDLLTATPGIYGARLVGGVPDSPVFTVAQTPDTDELPRVAGATEESTDYGWVATWQQLTNEGDIWLSEVPSDAVSDLTDDNKALRANPDISSGFSPSTTYAPRPSAPRWCAASNIEAQPSPRKKP